MLISRLARAREPGTCPFLSHLEPPAGVESRQWRWKLTLGIRVQLVPVQPHTCPPNRFEPERARGVSEKRLAELLEPGSGFVTDRHQDPYRLFHLREWTPQVWDAWSRRFLAHLHEAWNRQLWLRTPDRLHCLEWPPGLPQSRPEVECNLSVAAVNLGEEADVVLSVVRIDPHWRSPDQFTPYIDLGAQQASGLLHEQSLNPLGKLSAASHQWAYLLGVGVAVGQSPLRLAPPYARPWLQRIARHTGTHESEWEPRLARGEIDLPAPRPVVMA